MPTSPLHDGAAHPTPMLSVKPIHIAAPGRGDDLGVRVSAPATGTDLPLVILAHGFGESMSSYDPLVDHWAAHGLVVVQPTFLDSRTLGLDPTDPRQPDIWRIRVDDVERVIDHLDEILATVPGLSDRVNRERLAVAGHSWGGQTVGMLLGARVLDVEGQPGPSRRDPRVKAGVLLATTGLGDDLAPFALEHFGFMRPDFAQLDTPTLVVTGGSDQSPLSTRGPDWFTDVYRLSPGAEHLITVADGEHSLGGIQGYRSTDTTDENPEAVDLVRQVTLAYLLTALGADPDAWDRTSSRRLSADSALASIESR